MSFQKSGLLSLRSKDELTKCHIAISTGTRQHLTAFLASLYPFHLEVVIANLLLRTHLADVRVGLLTTKQNKSAKRAQNLFSAKNNPLAPLVLRKQTKTKYAIRVLASHDNFVFNSLLGAEPMSRFWQRFSFKGFI